MTNTDDYYMIAKLAQEAKRYEDMKNAMKKLAETSSSKELTTLERNLLSVAYKNIISSKRKSLRCLAATSQLKSHNLLVHNEYVSKIEDELKLIINEFIELLDKFLLPSSQLNMNLEGKSFYLKLKADFLRYLIEYCRNNEIKRELLIAQTNLAYKNAFDFIKIELNTCNRIKLGLALSYSTFFYEILNMPEQACELAKQAFDSAIMDLDLVENKDEIRDCKLFMRLLRDNLIVWMDNIDKKKFQDEY
jgi:hypothetical protein